MNRTLLRAERSCVLMVNMQHRLLVRAGSPREVAGNCRLVLRAAQALGMPGLAFEHQPEEFGPTVSELAELLPPEAVAAGRQYSAYDHPAVRRWALAAGRNQVVVCGIETQVGILQTVFGLLADEYACFVPADATGAHGAPQTAAALARLRDAGAAIVTVDMVLHEWAGAAGSANFERLRDLLG
jgi:nicotinamidase-related amidase